MSDIKKDIDEIKIKLTNLEILIMESFSKLERKINELEKNKLNHVQEACDKMNNHIDFIEETYTTLQTPLNYVKNKVEYLMGYNNDSKSLPTIKDKE
jgi:predicted nuclease with TOPRIM domain